MNPKAPLEEQRTIMHIIRSLEVPPEDRKMSIVGMDECVARIVEHFRECKREREARMERINDRALFNSFRLYYTRLPHSKRERRHFIHYIIRLGVWERLEGRHRRMLAKANNVRVGEHDCNVNTPIPEGGAI